MPRSSLIAISKIALSLSLTVALLEGSLRLAPSLVPPKILLQFEPQLRGRLAQGRFTTRADMQLVERDDGGPHLWIFKPYTDKVYDFSDRGVVRVTTSDDIGFCNAPGIYDAAPTIDLLTLGDSFTWCHAVRMADAWPIRLGEITGLRTYNLGKGGIGPFEYVQILKRFGIPKSPRVVVMNVYEGNDLRDATRYQAHHEGRTDEAGERVGKGGWRDTALGRHSYAFNLVAGGLSRLTSKHVRPRDDQSIDFHYRLVDGDVEVPFNLDHSDEDEVMDARRLRAGELDFGLFTEALVAFAALSREHDFTAVLSYSPAAHTAYRDYTVFDDPANKDVLAWFSAEQRRYFKRTAAKLGLVFVDLTPHLQAAITSVDPERLLYYPTTMHYTAEAHTLVASVLSEALRQRGMAR